MKWFKKLIGKKDDKLVRKKVIKSGQKYYDNEVVIVNNTVGTLEVYWYK